MKKIGYKIFRLKVNNFAPINSLCTHVGDCVRGSGNLPGVFEHFGSAVNPGLVTLHDLRERQISGTH